MGIWRPSVLATLLIGACAAVPADALASELIARKASSVNLQISRRGVALVTYKVGKRKQYVRASGAINAIPPAKGRRQVAFRLDYFDTRPAFRGVCRRYDGPRVAFLLKACKARDGSYWALQVWKRALPNFGRKATGLRAAPELRLSHWRGEIPALVLKADWSFDGRFEHVYGFLRYRGTPVYGFRSTSSGTPLDAFGRNVYLDTLNSSYGRGWKRENSFLTHRPHGNFCYHLAPGPRAPGGKGRAYRATVIGPGVTPDVSVRVESPGPYSRPRDVEANEEQLQIAPLDPSCRPS